MRETRDVAEILDCTRPWQPSYVVVYFAMERMRRSEDPIEASISKIQAITSLSPPTIVDARKALVAAGVIAEVPGLPGSYLILKNFAKLFYNTDTGTRLSTKKAKKQRTAQPSKKSKTTPEARREAVRLALRALGSPPNQSRLVGQAMRELYGLVERDGFEIADALEVARHCRAEYDRTRFRPMLSLPYIWASRQFTSLLTAAREARRDDGETLAEQQRRRDDEARRLRERGLL